MQAAPTVTETLAPPRHIAIIMDGNRRWARKHGMPGIAGHRRGAEAVRRAVQGCLDAGVEYLTLFAFSSENWKRPWMEVAELMNLLRFYLRREIDELHKGGIRVRFLGERSHLDHDIAQLMRSIEDKTRGNSRLVLTIALNYGSRREIALAARRLAEKVHRGEVELAAIDETSFDRELSGNDLPDPDLLIRTSGEQRLSNFLLWQLAYTELVFLPVLWPEFSEAHLLEAVAEYGRRERRYGASSA
ncbi:polyprenyl diphosphate synthase [Marinivivus vitaminiproducens]|uniref:polyprenyl diphosphate synthase n=1 Tax=Marinivivus vitaminiproducens TaxID=3035935 RepID=UPI00279F0981|nr:polyprenyl diphosphate synthase [Geminicoccaceae bacterium SCSIO 64248]